MCGINAILDLESKDRVNYHMDTLTGMNDRIHHRGPDGNNRLMVNESLFLGHLRLSIIDLSARGNQPMKKGDYTVTYNGEIYNYLEIRKELEVLGCEFISESDTEVLIEAYRIWGTDAFRKFNGMWALILHNAAKNQIIVARDRFGKKPLYYTKHQGSIYFSSEIKAFADIIDFELNRKIAFEYLQSGWQDQSEETFIQEVFQFPKGSFSKLCIGTENELSFHKYYRISDIRECKVTDLSFHEAKLKIRDLVFDSVQLRLRSDVDVAFALSGGIDSSIITAVAAKINRDETGAKEGKLKTFSSVFVGDEMGAFNEKKYIDAVLKEIPELSPAFVYPDVNDFINGLDQLLYMQDEPFVSAGMFAQQSVFELIHKNGVKVSLDGQGVDEAIGGYSSYNSIYLYELRKNRNSQFISELIGFAFHYPDLFYAWVKDKMKRNTSRPSIIGAGFGTSQEAHIPFNQPKTFEDHCIFQLDRLFLPALLHHQDRNSMAYGVESRSPFLDYRIVEFLISMPTSYKIKGGVRKYLLREAFKDLLPNEIYRRYSKLGFPAPLNLWMQKNHDFFRNMLSEALDSGIAGPPVLSEFDLQKETGYNDYLKFIRIIFLDKWIKVYNVKF
ncbi:MAG: asparagine synthase (glutamine-hydrolyzing) [Saprospiraceae bacterium]|nr:asparagine synthase (glutamine-hydrolyzing) [Saprospiraceae bacterium]MBK8851336.1 asparagine synthase (glutamine-hydrolyzing) [Saprospiraceae bacterium]MBK9688937.1 asparagine synthase (glutamine-hydrolyzing) [Saprospiraceae bacterium]